MSHHYFEPRPVCDVEAAGAIDENWGVYITDFFSAKRADCATQPHADDPAYRLILALGFGRIGNLSVETPTLIRFGQLTRDELFVAAATAQAGVAITNSQPPRKIWSCSSTSAPATRTRNH